jgi:hypothetical protein
MLERFLKNKIAEGAVDPATSYLMVDCKSFQRPNAISLQNIGKSLEIHLDQTLLSRLDKVNVTAHSAEGQEGDPSLPPDTTPVSVPLHLAADENYLYVWVEKSSCWKRLPLSSW